jgi:hypothetical protein
MHCSGAGLMCLVFHSLLVVHAEDSVTSICLPTSILEFDLRGSVDVHGFRADTIRIDVGEVKSKLDYSSAVTQLGVRLNALKCLTSILAGERFLTHALQGRLFFSQHFGIAGDIDPIQ